jgi:hypothetical protein
LDVLCYSARFIPPFAQALSTYGGYAVESLNRLKAIDPACRIPASIANELAVRQVADTGDPDLGFKAARAMHVGRAGPLDYAMLSAASLRRAIEVGDRYVRSYSDVLNVRLTVQGSRAMLRARRWSQRSGRLRRASSGTGIQPSARWLAGCA